jgi:N-acetylneuraminic acid mutarotase
MIDIYWSLQRATPIVVLLLALLVLITLAPGRVSASDAPVSLTDNQFRTGCPAHPSARGYSNMVYDWATGNAYLFGGTDHVGFVYSLFDVWSYNSFTQRWKLLVNSDTLFNAFQADDRVLDPQSKKVLIFSTFVNCDASGFCGVETWIYDIATNTFENVAPAVQPSLRWGYRIAYDTQSKRAILFGGSDGYTGETLNDTWVYNFETNAWTEMQPATSPPPHHFAAMTYHPLADRVILFGGYNIQADEYLNDTWAYDYNSNTWTDLQPTTRPSARVYHTIAWDLWSNKIILFGGVSNVKLYEPVLDDSWAFDLKSNTWTKLKPKASPSARAWHAMVGTWTGPLLFGGGPTHDVFTDDDTWSYNSRAKKWEEIGVCKTKGKAGLQ